MTIIVYRFYLQNNLQKHLHLKQQKKQQKIVATTAPAAKHPYTKVIQFHPFVFETFSVVVENTVEVNWRLAFVWAVGWK